MDKYNTINDFLSEDIRTLKVFKQFKVPFHADFFSRDLRELCAEKNIDEKALYKALNQLLSRFDRPVHDYNNWNLGFLMDYIVNTHHRYIKTTLPILIEYAGKIEKEHMDSLHTKALLSEACNQLKELLLLHMSKEENILFPYIQSLDKAYNEEKRKEENYGLVKSINALVVQHDQMHQALFKIEELISNCHELCQKSNNYNSLVYKLKEFKEDMIVHHHIENNILYKKAILNEKQQYN